MTTRETARLSRFGTACIILGVFLWHSVHSPSFVVFILDNSWQLGIITLLFWSVSTEESKTYEQSTQLLHDIAQHDGWLRTDSTCELWTRLQAWKRDHP